MVGSTDWRAITVIRAAKRGDADRVRSMLAKGADINVRGRADWTALMVASFDGHREVARVLLSKAAEVDAKGPVGNTALIVAANFGFIQVAQARATTPSACAI